MSSAAALRLSASARRELPDAHECAVTTLATIAEQVDSAGRGPLDGGNAPATLPSLLSLFGETLLSAAQNERERFESGRVAALSSLQRLIAARPRAPSLVRSKDEAHAMMRYLVAVRHEVYFSYVPLHFMRILLTI